MVDVIDDVVVEVLVCVLSWVDVLVNNVGGVKGF